jgi:hypothetical protein
MQSGPPAVSSTPQHLAASSQLPTDPSLIKKGANILLGQFLVNADLILQNTLDAALLLQDMVKNGVFDMAQASEALVRAHNRGALEASVFTAKRTNVEKVAFAPPLGQLMLQSGLVDEGALSAALKLQEAARTGLMSKTEALDTFIQETFGRYRAEHDDDKEALERIIDLLRQVGALTDRDVEVAAKLQEKHNGELMKILITAGKIDSASVESAVRVHYLVQKKRVKPEQAVIVLDYCIRSRVTADEALIELGWNKSS